MRIIALLLASFYTLLLYGESNVKMYAHPLYIHRGMNQSTVYSMYQDEFGMVWFATQRGLIRYDGTEMKQMEQIYADIPDADELVRAVTGDRQGHLYIETRAGIIEYDMRTDRFRRIVAHSRCISYADSCLWIGNGNRIYRYKDDTLTEYYALPESGACIDCIMLTPQGNLYAGTVNHGLYCISRSKSVRRLLPNVSQIKQLHIDSGRRIWVATSRNGLYLIDTNEMVKSFTHSGSDTNTLSSNIVRSLCEDNVGNIWIGTFNGLTKYDKHEDRFIRYEFIDENTYSLNDESFYCLMKDRQGCIWSGTFHGKINCFHPEYNTFSYYLVPKEQSLNDNKPAVFGKTVEDKAGNLYMVADRGGLYYFQTRTRQLTRLPIADNVQSLFYDHRHEVLWIGTLLDGLKRYDPRQKSISAFARKTLHGRSIRDIIPYNESLIITTHNRISLLDIHTGTNTLLRISGIHSSTMLINTIQLDSQKRLWIAIENQLFCYNLPDKKCQEYRLNTSAEKVRVTKVIETAAGEIMAGTSRHGVLRLAREDSLFTPYIKYCAQVADVVDMCEDETGGLVIAANNGLTYIDRKGNLASVDRNRFLSSFRIGRNCLFVDRYNQVYFGGVNMFCTFPLKQIFRGSLRYDVGISDMSVNGKTVPSIRYTDRIKLDYEQRSFKVQAYTNNYASPFTCGIMYKLEPFDHEWLHANNLNEISYTNLSSGNYTLYIRGDAAQADGTYPEHRLAIVIHPPFYRTTLAFLLYGLLLLLLSYGIYYVTVLRASLRMEQAQQRNREELNQSKFRFFTNISHEFKTPLTLLSNQVELLLQNHTLSASVNTKLLSVWRNIVRLNRLIVELIEFRRQEQGITPLKVNRNNLVELMVGVTDAFREYAQTRKISLNRFAEQPEICFMFDRQLMERALFNLLSNAFKFTPENGTISVHLKQLGKQALIEVSDTGIGIDADELEHIFEHFYQTSNVSFTNSVGTGIGLAYTKNIVEAHQGIITVKSIKSKGSTFTILLPVNVVYEQNQIANSLSIIKDNEVVSGIAIPPIAPAERSVRACKEETMRYRLLIVEDDAELRELLAETFASQYSVEVAANGRIGYDKAIGELPDIVISDVMMPEMSGTELCRKLKNNLRTSHIPVILLTSQSAPEYVCEGLTVGADDYIGKPFSIKHLFIRCNNLVNLRHTLQQKYAHEIASDSTQLALSPLDQQLLDTAVRLIEENLDNPQFSVDFLSRETGMGRTRYYAKMKAITGMTPNEFVLNHKLKMACRLIDAHPERSITELAESLGFSNTSYFIQRFKEFTGDTPHNYRQKMIS